MWWATAIQLWNHGPPFLQTRSRTTWLSSIGTAKKHLARKNTWQCESSGHLLGTCTWHSLLLRQNTNLGVTLRQMVRCQWLLCEIWNVPSATNMSGTHWCLMRTICYQCFRYTLKSNVYHVLPIFQVHIEVWRVPSATRFQVHTEVRTQLSASECLTYFFKLFLSIRFRILQLSVFCSKAEIK